MGMRIGVFGGGQLGAYLCQAAASLDIETFVVCFTPTSMAIEYSDHHLIAEPEDAQAAEWLVANCDVITFDTESVPPGALRILEEANAGVRVAPSVDTLRMIQDKYTQKHWLATHGFPTAPFVDCDTEVTVTSLRELLGSPFIQKARRGGYDGKGVQLVDTAASDDSLWRGDAIAERYVANKRELAVLVARTADGEAAVYPVVEMLFEETGHVLREACSPADLDAEAAERAQRLGKRIIEKMDGVGLFAIEFFLEMDGTLLVNEISPRVHNTGHLTIEAHETSQYEQHLRAIAGMALGSVVQRSPAAVMLNVLNEAAAETDSCPAAGSWTSGPDTVFHWYGKPGGARFRKMGHITSVANSRDEALHLAETALSDWRKREHVA